MNDHLKDALDYFKGFCEGDNITITADFVNNVEEIEEGLNKKDKGEIKMEKDKLMELLNSMVEERKNIDNEIHCRETNKVIKGLGIIKECLEFGESMAKFFKKLNISSRTIVSTNNYFITFDGDKFVISIRDSWGFWDSKYSMLTFSKTFEEIMSTNDDTLHLGAKRIAVDDFKVDTFISKVNEILAYEIMKYQAETIKRKETLK